MSQNSNPFENKDIVIRNADEQWASFCKYYFDFDHLEANLAQQLYLKKAKENIPFTLGVSGVILTASTVLAIFSGPLCFFILPVLFLVGTLSHQAHAMDACKKSIEDSRKIFNKKYSQELLLFPSKSKKGPLKEDEQKLVKK